MPASRIRRDAADLAPLRNGLSARPVRWRPELIVALGLAALTRFWHLSWPRTLVFDEGPYVEYASAYFPGAYYFNLHPPVGKLLLALAARMLGIAPAMLANPDAAVALRVLPALAGTLIIPVFWLLLRQLGASRRVAILGAFLLLVDNALLSVSRLVLLDSMLILFMLGAVTAWLASRGREGAVRWLLIGLSGVLAGLAVGTKWTGLSALAIVLLAWFREIIVRREARRALAAEGFALVALPAVVYVGAFVVHFALLPNAGRAYGVMSPAFQETLVGTPTFREDARIGFVSKIADLHRAMRQANADYRAVVHPGASPWWSWPILKHPIFIWRGEPDGAGRSGYILIEGNPAVWWTILIALAALGLAAVTARTRRPLGAQRDALLLLLAAFLINYVPFAFIGRTLFLYAYFPAMVFSLALAVVGVGSLAEWMNDADRVWQFPRRRSAAFYWSVAGLSVAAFIYFAPLSYGTPVSEAALRRRMWLLERHTGQP